MSEVGDWDRGRRRFKRKESKGKESEGLMLTGTMPGKTPIILSKPPGERVLTRTSSAEALRLATKPSSSTGTVDHNPPRILKSKDERSRTSVSPAPAGTPTTPTFSLPGAKDSDEPVGALFPTSAPVALFPKIQIQQKTTSALSNSTSTANIQSTEKNNSSEGVSSSSLDARLAPYPEMKMSVKLIDESLQWCDQTFEFLQDQCDFLVVGILGLQGTGKSTIMSILAGSQGYKTSRTGIFKPQSRDQRELGEHCTKGVDIFVTNHRIILLDVQPMLSASVMDHMIQFEKKFPSEYSSTENALEIQSLQIAAFLLTVCHTVIVAQDWFADPNMLRFIQAAEMLRPSALLPSHDSGMDDTTEYCPHLVLLQNKCLPSDFEPSKIKLMQETYSLVFRKSKLKYRGPVGIASGSIIPCLQPETCGDSINIFLLPWKETSETDDTSSSLPEYKGHPGFQQLAKALRYQIVSMPRSQMAPSTLTEKNWFHYSARTWETVKKSGLFMEYCRLLA